MRGCISLSSHFARNPFWRHRSSEPDRQNEDHCDALVPRQFFWQCGLERREPSYVAALLIVLYLLVHHMQGYDQEQSGQEQYSQPGTEVDAVVADALGHEEALNAGTDLTETQQGTVLPHR